MSLPTRDEELWGLALSIERQHGKDGPRVIAERIGAFVLAGEVGAVELWREVAERYEKLLSPPSSRRS
ncbi:MAG: hypothetical protein KDK08_07790 [Rhizobiaceae bacterium]|nr:hypothetical protein [Rhizobiaceae bacterium]